MRAKASFSASRISAARRIQRGAFGERGAAIGAERLGCARQLFVQLRFGERVERGQTFTGGGVYGGDHYSLFSDSRRATRSPPAR